MEIIWTDFAIASLKNIYDYFARHVSREVANNIKASLFNATRQLETQPESGQIEPLLMSLKKSHRYIISGNYKIIYRVENNTVIINDVFDTRQNPKKLIQHINLNA